MPSPLAMSDPLATSPQAVNRAVPKRSRSGCKILLLTLAALALVLGGFWWWHNRAIRPVELSPDEKAALDQKLEAIFPESADATAGDRRRGNDAEIESDTGPAPSYERGKREFVITERELNGLLNEHTKLGQSVHFELVDGAVHARVAADLDPDVPIVGGKNLKARARFFVETRDGSPELVLDDLTVWGVSLPNDWLGGLKGKNALAEIFGEGPQLSGIERLEVERGRLIIKLKE